MFKKQYLFSTIILVLLAGLSGCSKQEKKSAGAKAMADQQIKRIKVQIPKLKSTDPRVVQQTKQQVTVRAKKLNKKDCIQMFGKKGKKLLNTHKSDSLNPIQLSIENKSKQPLQINKKSLNIKTVHPKKAYERLQQFDPGNKKRWIIGGVLTGLGVLLAPIVGILISAGVAAAGVGHGCLLGIVVGGAASGIFFGIPVVTGVGIGTTAYINHTRQSTLNKSLKNNLNKRQLRKLDIKSQQRADLLIFVSEKNIKPNLELTLFDTHRQSKFNSCNKPIINFTLNLDATVAPHYKIDAR